MLCNACIVNGCPISDDFLESAEFKKISTEFIPGELQDHAVRHQAYTEELRAYSRVAEHIRAACEREVIDHMTAGAERFIARLDRTSSPTKSPRSIDDKIFRYLSGNSVAGHKIGHHLKKKLRDKKAEKEVFLKTFFRDLHEIMNDLARFRIIGNFLSDVHAICDRFNDVNWAAHGIQLKPNIDDRIVHDRWLTGAGGHRAIHMTMFVTLNDRPIHVEVQLMTLLETGWDAKSHMYYELTRQGEGNLDQETKLKIQAMSDMLYVADALFDDLLSKFEEGAT